MLIFPNCFFILHFRVFMSYKGIVRAFSQDIFHCECCLSYWSQWFIFFKVWIDELWGGLCVVEIVFLPLSLFFLNLFLRSLRIGLILWSLLFVLLFPTFLPFFFESSYFFLFWGLYAESWIFFRGFLGSLFCGCVCMFLHSNSSVFDNPI